MSQIICKLCGEFSESAIYHNFTNDNYGTEPPKARPICIKCEIKYPATLIDASIDLRECALGLKSGAVFVFQEARLWGEWVSLENVSSFRPSVGDQVPFKYCQKVEVRVSDIVWCAKPSPTPLTHAEWLVKHEAEWDEELERETDQPQADLPDKSA